MSTTTMSTTKIAHRPLPLWAEIGRQVRRRRTIGIFAVLTVLPLVLLLAFWLGDDGNDPGQRGFVDLAQESGANLVIFTLFASTSFLLIVIVALFAGDTVPSEATWASLRYLLSAPVRRERRPQAEADRGPSHPGLRASDDHALCRSPQSIEVLHERRERPPDLGAGVQELMHSHGLLRHGPLATHAVPLR